MKLYPSILILLFPLLVGFNSDKDLKSSKTNLTNGFIDIVVESNINRLLFTYDIYERCFPFSDKHNSGNNYDTSDSRIIVPVKDVKYPNRYAYKDFLNLLKADQYPFLEIVIPNDNFYTSFTKDTLILKGVYINVAGVTKEYNINCNVEKNKLGNQTLNGTIRLKLTDLNIVPPVKSFGLVKVKDEFIINFGFCITDSWQPNIKI
jgi:hypothetical protein